MWVLSDADPKEQTATKACLLPLWLLPLLQAVLLMQLDCMDRGGQDCFLAAAEALQHVLLPLLSPRDLFRLGCTSKAMRQWIQSTPASLWRVSSSAL